MNFVIIAFIVWSDNFSVPQSSRERGQTAITTTEGALTTVRSYESRCPIENQIRA